MGSIIYIMLNIRPDLAFIISMVSRFSFNPILAYLLAVKRIFQYIQDIIHIGLVFRRLIKPLTGYIDSN
jgi:hypothetical protein